MQAMPMSPEQSSLDTALDQLLAGRWSPTAWERIHQPEELPWRFEELAGGLRQGTWRAFTNGAQLAFAVGDFVRGHRKADEQQVVVRFYDAGARCCVAGVWALDDAGEWTLREVLD